MTQQYRDVATGHWINVVEMQGTQSSNASGTAIDTSSLSKEATQLLVLSKLDVQLGELIKLGDISDKLNNVLTQLGLMPLKTDTIPVSIVSGSTGGGGGGTVGGATEATLNEVKTILDNLTNKTETQPVSLASIPLATGAATEATITSILTKLNTLAGKTETQPVSLDGVSSEATLVLIKNLITNLAAKTENQPVSISSLPLATNAATESTLSTIGTLIAELTTPNDIQITRQLIRTYTPTFLRTSTSGTISSGKESISINNVGIANGTVLGVTLKPDEGVSFEAPQNCILSSVSYDATGTEFLINHISADAGGS